MILCVAVQVSTGLFANNDDTAMEGPLAKWVSGSLSNLLTGIDHLNFNILLVLLAVHIGAVVCYLVYKKENLITAMFTGRKHLPEALAAAERCIGGSGLALVIVAIAAAAVYFLLQ